MYIYRKQLKITSNHQKTPENNTEFSIYCTKIPLYFQTQISTTLTLLIFGVHHSNFKNLIIFSFFFNNLVFLPLISQFNDLVSLVLSISCLSSIHTTPNKLNTQLNITRLILVLTWASAFFIALDWKEAWQEWPVPNVYAAVYASFVGEILGFFGVLDFGVNFDKIA